MDGLRTIGVVCVVFSLLVSGCGKKKSQKSESSSKKLAQVDSIPLANEEVENLLDDNSISEFAFVDDIEQKDSATAQNENKALVLDDQNVSFDEDEDFATETSAYAFKAVNFDFDKNTIRADQRPVVAQNVEKAKEFVNQGKVVVIEGHCDQIGSAGYNLALSQRRAEAVKAEMTKSGIDQHNVKTVGYGYERPLVWSDAKERNALIKELAANRRAEVLVN